MPRRDALGEIVGVTTRNKGGSVFAHRKSMKITDLSELPAAELQFARAYAATLKATGWSWRYISDTLNIQTKLVKEWADDPAWVAMVDKVAKDVVGGAIEHLQKSSVDLVEMLLELARVTTDDAVKLRAIEAALDRVGISKVNKSESKVTKTEQHEHTIFEGMFDQLSGLPLETQQDLAKLAAEADELVAQAKGKE